MEYVSHSEDDTVEVGRQIAAELAAGDVLSLNGELGTGKTRLVAGIASHFGLPTAEVTSPTFSLIHEYATDPPLAHCDAYRLADSNEFLDLGVSELWIDGIVVVEWGDRVADALPTWTRRLEGTVAADGTRRFAFRDRS